MDLGPTVEEKLFREEARTWLEENVPKERRPEHGPESAAFDREWQLTQFEAGWAGISWPREHGGRGASLTEQVVWHEEYSRAGAPPLGVSFVGLSHAGPTLIEEGREDQKDFHLPRILRGESVWCQGFSEPGAGSDLASVRTRAEIVGEQLVVNGQKIWSSSALYADYQELLARTDPEAGKHAGISWIICDMRTPGITVRPITTMDGGAEHFCEVFYDDVRIPLSNVVGKLHGGWAVAMANLGFERATSMTAAQIQLGATLEELIQLAGQTQDGRGGTLLDDDDLRRRLARCRADVVAMRSMTYGTISRLERTKVPGPEGSMVRLYFTQLVQRLYRLAMDVLGPDALDWDVAGQDGRPWVREFLRSYKETIAGGTKDIQRNIIAQRVLGLPRG